MSKPQVILIWKFSGHKFRLVNKYGDTYVIDIQCSDSVGDLYWREHTATVFKKDISTNNLLMSAVLHLLNPNAVVANDAELEGRSADADNIIKQAISQQAKDKDEVANKLAELFNKSSIVSDFIKAGEDDKW